MGNSLRVSLFYFFGQLRVSLLGNTGSPRFPCHLQLGGSAVIDFSKTASDKDDDGLHREIWSVSYTVDGKTCKVALVRFVEQEGNVNRLYFTLDDKVYCICCRFSIAVTITETGFLWIRRCQCTDFESFTSIKMNRTIDVRGGVTETTIYLYGNENKGGVVVQEVKENSRDEDPNALTVAHYFVNRKGVCFFITEETDIGLSVVAKIRVSNGQLDTTVEGPEQHPASALLYMFEEVNKTKVWKPNMCPHCSNIRRQQINRMWSLLSDSEDSDGGPLARDHGSQQNSRGMANGGRFVGNGNGNFFENNVMMFRRRWW